jgi:serine/threonine protein phosphatase PrpC
MSLFKYFKRENPDIETFNFLKGKLATCCFRKPLTDGVNEDSAAAIELSSNHGVLLVADGMGGHHKGDEASKLAIESVLSSLKSQKHSSAREAIMNGIEKAQENILKLGGNSGSTLVVCEVEKNSCRFYSLGDSIGMVLSGQGQIKYRTVEQSPVGYAVESEMLTEEEAIEHPDSHLLSYALGFKDYKIQVSAPIELATRDRILLASDGLTSCLTSEQIAEIIYKEEIQQKLLLLRDKVIENMVIDGSPTEKCDDLTILTCTFD